MSHAPPPSQVQYLLSREWLSQWQNHMKQETTGLSPPALPRFNESLLLGR